MAKALVIEVNGETYLGVQTFADAFNIDIKTVKGRRRRGWTWEKIASTPIRARQVIEVNGETYWNVVELAKAYNINVQTVRSRRKLGWSWEKIVSTPVTEIDIPEIEYKGKRYLGYKVFGDAFGLSVTTVKRRYDAGWTWEQIATTPVKEVGSRPDNLVYKGVKYNSYTALAKTVNMSCATLSSRIHRGMTIEEAVETPIIAQGEIPLLYKGVNYKSVSDLAEELDVPERILSEQLALFDSIEDAIVAVQKWKRVKTTRLILGRKDVAGLSTQVGGKYVLLTCKVCGRKVMLPLEDARRFVHSDDCIRNEWL